MLQKPSEQEKLLLKLPEVVAEELEPEVSVAAASEKIEINDCSPKSILRGSSDVSSTDASGFGEVGTPPKVILSDSHALKVQNGGVDGVVHVPIRTPEADIVEQGMPVPNLTCDESIPEMQEEENPRGEPEQPPITTCAMAGPDMIRYSSCTELMGSGENILQGKPEQRPSSTTVIELSDDDSEDDAPKATGGTAGENPNDFVWHYRDPQGQTQGPFPLSLLKRWSDANYFHSGFTVWRSGQSSDDGVILVDVLRRTFPH